MTNRSETIWKCVSCGLAGLALYAMIPGHTHTIVDVTHGMHVEKYLPTPQPPAWAGYSATMASVAMLSGWRGPRRDGPL